MDPIYMLLAIPMFFLMMGIEYLVGWFKKQQYYRFNDAITNLCIGIGSQAISLFLKGILLGGYVLIFEHLSVIAIPVTWWTTIACFLVFDFLYYWAHRWSHEVNFFWGAHVVHHQSEDYNLSVALRQSWFHALLMFFIFVPMPIMGFVPMQFFGVALFVTLYQFWIHTQAIDKMPDWFEYIFNTPSHHRVHHGVNPKYIDKNHAATLILWDRIFGTFQIEEEAPTYGITTPLKSLNPTWANFQYYVEIFQKARTFSSWKEKIKILWAPPGWLPEDQGGQQYPEEIDEATYTKYDPAPKRVSNVYVLLQFILIAVGLTVYMYRFEELSTFYQWVFLGAIILSTMICGAIMENKPWVQYAEYGRLLLVLASLNSCYYYWYFDWFTVMLVGSGVGFLVFVTWFTYGWRLVPVHVD